MKRIKIRHRLSFFIILGVISTCLLGLLFVHRSQRLYEEMIYQETAEKFQLYSQRIEEKMKEIDKLSLRIMSDVEVQKALANIAYSRTSFSSFESAKLLSRKLVTYDLYGNAAQSVLIGDRHSMIHSGGPLLEAVNDQKLNDYLEHAAVYEGASVWIGGQQPGKLFVSLREIREIENLSLRRLGVLAVQVPAEVIVHEAYSSTRDSDSSLIIQSQDQTVYSDFEHLQVLPKFITAPSKKYGVITIDNEKYLFASFTLSYSDWTFIHLLPYGTIFESLSSMKVMLVVMYGLVCLLLLYLGWKFSRSITRPLEMLSAKMAQVEKGDFEIEQLPEPDNHDEIWLLDRKLDHMTIRVDHLINENYVKQMKLREAEYEMLQAKLNPHFLYNTLDSINWLARMNGQDAISSMVKALGDLLRASIHNKELNTLGEELAIVQKYITIQQFRFEERLRCEITVAGELYDLLMPSMMLQPIVENCVKYGIDASSGVCRIRIHAEQCDRLFILTIQDSGSGDIDPADAYVSSSGLGLRSINERLRLMYGEGYELQFLEHPNEGTTVTITLPILTESGISQGGSQ